MIPQRARAAAAVLCAALAACAQTGPPGAASPASLPQPAPPAAQTAAEVLAASKPEEWRPLDRENTLVMTLADGGELVIALSPAYAPKSIANIQTLVAERYFDGLAILRVHDNYVAQWGDPKADDPDARPLGAATATVPAELDVPRDPAVPFTPLADGDVYASEVGFSGAMPAARDQDRMWLAHCYAMVGVARDAPADSGSGAQLYAVIGHAPRHLDRNVTLVGRVVSGIERLSALKRGAGALGFYDKPEERLGIVSVRLASELPGGGPAGRLEVLAEDTASFAALTESRRNRRDPWTKHPAGKIELCNVLLPVRERGK